MSTPVHFVGSIGLDTVEEVFTTVGGELKPRLPRCPDGEVGGRRLWITWQWPLLRSSPHLQVDTRTLIPGLGLCQLRLDPAARADDVAFGELGYAREARSSYQDFLAARERGQIAPGTRFQVSLPTPFAVVQAFIVPEDAPRVLPAYETAMLREIARLTAAIPPTDLALQWDVCMEMLIWDGRTAYLAAVPDMERAFGLTFARLCGAVPAAVQLGFHLCYGDLDAEHAVQPEDLGKAVGLANLLLRSAPRAVDWIHMPVPRSREDESYYAPLRDFQGRAATQIYLGLVHADGAAATLRRMRAAARHASGFGIATECGIARARRPELVREIIHVHAAAAQAFDAQ
ncbi:MAG: hypothetical protein IT480_14050 [Gammaproteobacteria bacterium]|nr:hypothetical protein [Gammaproteobacteria bacterium]